MTLRARLAKIEKARPQPADAADTNLDLDLPPDLCARISQAQAAGTFPQSLSDDDLLAVVAARDKSKGWA